MSDQPQHPYTRLHASDKSPNLILDTNGQPLKLNPDLKDKPNPFSIIPLWSASKNYNLLIRIIITLLALGFIIAKIICASGLRKSTIEKDREDHSLISPWIQELPDSLQSDLPDTFCIPEGAMTLSTRGPGTIILAASKISSNKESQQLTALLWMVWACNFTTALCDGLENEFGSSKLIDNTATRVIFGIACALASWSFRGAKSLTVAKQWAGSNKECKFSFSEVASAVFLIFAIAGVLGGRFLNREAAIKGLGGSDTLARSLNYFLLIPSTITFFFSAGLPFKIAMEKIFDKNNDQYKGIFLITPTQLYNVMDSTPKRLLAIVIMMVAFVTTILTTIANAIFSILSGFYLMTREFNPEGLSASESLGLAIVVTVCNLPIFDLFNNKAMIDNMSLFTLHVTNSMERVNTHIEDQVSPKSIGTLAPRA